MCNFDPMCTTKDYKGSYPVSPPLEGGSALEVRLEELVGEVLCEECEKGVRTLWLGFEHRAPHQSLHNLTCVR